MINDRLTTLIASLIPIIIWLFFILWSAWMEWHNQHDHAIWVMLLLIANSLGWLKRIRINTERIK